MHAVCSIDGVAWSLFFVKMGIMGLFLKKTELLTEIFYHLEEQDIIFNVLNMFVSNGFDNI